MHRRQAIATLGFAAGLKAAPAIRDRFIGVWKLVSYENKRPNGEVIQVYGPNPVGRIMYEKSGRMAATLMRPGRKPPQDPRTPTPEELREIQSGFVAYFGTFDVDESAQTVIHHVEAALNPAWPGTDLKRHYDFSGDRLTLSTGTLTLVWQREPD